MGMYGEGQAGRGEYGLRGYYGDVWGGTSGKGGIWTEGILWGCMGRDKRERGDMD